MPKDNRPEIPESNSDACNTVQMNKTLQFHIAFVGGEYYIQQQDCEDRIGVFGKTACISI